MNRSCPRCHASNVRRSSTIAAEVTWRNHLLSRYRCRECLTQFWVVSRKTYGLAALVAGAIVLAVIAILVLDQVLAPETTTPSRQRSEAVPEQPARMADLTLPQPFVQRVPEPS